MAEVPRDPEALGPTGADPALAAALAAVESRALAIEAAAATLHWDRARSALAVFEGPATSSLGDPTSAWATIEQIAIELVGALPLAVSSQEESTGLTVLRTSLAGGDRVLFLLCSGSSAEDSEIELLWSDLEQRVLQAVVRDPAGTTEVQPASGGWQVASGEPLRHYAVGPDGDRADLGIEAARSREGLTLREAVVRRHPGLFPPERIDLEPDPILEAEGPDSLPPLPGAEELRGEAAPEASEAEASSTGTRAATLASLASAATRAGASLRPRPAAPRPGADASEAPPADHRKCRDCGASLAAAARFCSECGRAVSEETGAAAPALCTRCGETLRTGARFCTGCGAPQAEQPGPAARAAAAAVAHPVAPAPPVAAQPLASPSARPSTPGVWSAMLNASLTFLPGLLVVLVQSGRQLLDTPQRLLTLLMPCLLSIVSIGLAPKIGRWASIVLVLGALALLAAPLLLGEGGDNAAGRSLIGVSCLYAVMRLVRAPTRR